MNDLLVTIVLGIIEGVTEFLPVSSTGHLLLFGAILPQVNLEEGFWKTFVVFIQIGAIAAVAVYFRQRLWRLITRRPESSGQTPLEMLSRRASGTPPMPPDTNAVDGGGTAVLTRPATHVSTRVTPHPTAPVAAFTPARHPLVNIAIATAPALVIGYLTHEWIENNFASPLVVAAALAVGGVAMWLIELAKPAGRTTEVEQITPWQAIGIGFVQVLAALFPGTSRSAATIMGGMLMGLNRGAAAEFSFFVAIPVMTAACGFSLLKWVVNDAAHITGREILLMGVGTLVSFLVAWVVIAAFMAYIRRYSFVPFAIYRLIVAAVVFLAFS